MHDANVDLNSLGFELFGPVVAAAKLESIRTSLFAEGQAGARCLLDEPTVREIAVATREILVGAGRLTATAVAIQAITFDKTPAANWKVTWHQDLMFPFARTVATDGFAMPTIKGGVTYARPPRSVLEELLAVRIHLDDCDETNGPLRVSPGTHRKGVIPSAEIGGVVARGGEHACLAQAGEALLMKPLLLHASSQAKEPKHRRVLHLVYHSGEPTGEPWHRSV
ncbi:MAG: phytanoyl-CoA dioxygenase family protein [Verrucomicrobiota bacterium]